MLDYISMIPKTWDCCAESNKDENLKKEGPEGLPPLSMVSDCDRLPTNEV